jgi:hypothetical protein
MKKMLALVLSLVMVFALCACGGSDDTDTTAEEPVAPAADAAEPAAPGGEVATTPAEEAPEGDGSGEMGASGEMSGSGEMGGAQTGNTVDLSVNASIPTEAEPETYTADEDGWKQYMLDCAYYAMGTSDSDNKLGATYYDILEGNMTDMFVNMWGVDSQETFVANGGNPTVAPWSLAEGQGTPDTVPDAE